MAGHTLILRNRAIRERAKIIIDKAPENFVVTISEPKRTKEQSDKMWAMLTDISLAKPQGRSAPPERWKIYVMRALKKEVEMDTDLDGELFDVGYRSSKLSVKDMSDMIEWMYAYGAEQGVIWSEPKQKDAA